MVGPSDVSPDVVDCPVLKSWLAIPSLCTRGAEGKMAYVMKDNIDRQTVADNADMLEPLISELGFPALMICKLMACIQHFNHARKYLIMYSYCLSI